MQSILAIDQGTTASKGLILHEDGSIHTIPSRRHKTTYPKRGWVEHDPGELLRNIELIIQTALRHPHKISAMGLDNQGETVIAWDRFSGQPLYNAIVWQDTRTQETIERMIKAGMQEMTLEKAGLPLDSYFSASKFAWLWENVPEVQYLARQGRLGLGTSDAYFLERLTGQYITDVATAARTSLLNLSDMNWDPALCELFGVPIDVLPRISPNIGAIGEVVMENATIPLTAAIVDQHAALFGHRCRQKGDAKITFGTGAFALAVTGAKRAGNVPGLINTLAWMLPGEGPTYAVDGGVYNAASALNWLRSIGLVKSFNGIGKFSKGAAIERGLVFVPALSGLASPYWDRSAAGTWIGLTLETQKEDMVQAVLEGIALRMGQVFKTMDKVIDQTDASKAISIDGGVSLNHYFQEFLATVLERPVKISNTKDITAYGCALLAAKGAGWDIEAHGFSHINTTRITKPSKTAQSSKWLDRFGDAVERTRGWW